MTLITNDPERLMQIAGFDAWYHSLPPKLGIDQFRSVLPIMVAAEGARPVIVAKEIDRTNLEAIGTGDVDFAYHTPYFTFDAFHAPSDAYPSLPDAVAAIAEGKLELDPRMSVRLYAELRGALGLSDGATSTFCAPLHHYRIGREGARSPSRGDRSEAIEAAGPYIESLGRESLEPWLTPPSDHPLDSLDRLMAGQEIDVVLSGTPVNVQELSGVPSLLAQDDVFVVYARGSDEVHLLSRRELSWPGLPEAGTATARSVLDVAEGGRIGFEELNLTQAALQGFGLAGGAEPASTVLRRWRELRSWEDLPYYVMGAQVTVAGIDAALGLVKQRVDADQSVTELDAYRRYREVVASEIQDRGLPIGVRTYFTHTHAGDRSRIPARATDHPLNPLTSLKIDAGLEVYDRAGALRAASDITRSVVGTAEAWDAYRVLETALVDHTIAACRPGRTGDEVFASGIAGVERHRADLIAGGFCPDTGSALDETFGRDIGHLLGKQEPATTVLEKGNAWPLAPGMVAAAEIQWPYRPWCIGVEDVFMVTEGDPVNLTRPAS